jgi:hypothetical protein
MVCRLSCWIVVSSLGRPAILFDSAGDASEAAGEGFRDVMKCNSHRQGSTKSGEGRCEPLSFRTSAP